MLQTKLIRHIKSKHHDQIEVKQIESLPTQSERNKDYSNLRKKGTYKLILDNLKEKKPLIRERNQAIALCPDGAKSTTIPIPLDCL